MGPYETAGFARQPYDTAGMPRQPSDAVHRLAQSLESGDPRQIMMTLGAEHQQVMRAHPNDPQRAQAEMNGLRNAANLEAAQYDRNNGLAVVQLRPYRTADNHMAIGVARLNNSGWEQWDRGSQSWIREGQMSQVPMSEPYRQPAPYAQPLDRRQVYPASRPNLDYDWSRYDYTPGSVLPGYDGTAYGGVLRYPDPRYAGDPRYSDTQYAGDPRYGVDPRYRDPRYVGPAGYDDLGYAGRTYDPSRMPVGDRFDQLLALERRIYQEEIRLQQMIQQVSNQERWIQQQQMQSGYAPNYAGRPYREDLWRYSTPQRQWPYQYANPNQYAYQQYANPNQYAYQQYTNPNQYAYQQYAYQQYANQMAYQQSPWQRHRHPYYGSNYASGYATPGVSVGVGGNGFRIGAYLPIG